MQPHTQLYDPRVEAEWQDEALCRYLPLWARPHDIDLLCVAVLALDQSPWYCES